MKIKEVSVFAIAENLNVNGPEILNHSTVGYIEEGAQPEVTSANQAPKSTDQWYLSQAHI